MARKKASGTQNYKGKTDLLSILQDFEESSATAETGQIAQQQERALEFYRGKLPLKQTRSGLSDATSLDVSEATDWAMAEILTGVMTGWQACEISPWMPGIEGIQLAKQVSAWADDLIRNQEDSFNMLSDFLWDGLLARIGVVRVDVHEPEAVPFKYMNVNPQGLDILMNTPKFLITAQEWMPGKEGQEMMVSGFQKMKKTIKITNVPPEEFMIAPAAVSLCQETPNDLIYCGQRRRVSRGMLRKMYPNSDVDFNSLPSAASEIQPGETEGRLRVRHEENYGIQYQLVQKTENFVLMRDEYVRYDQDGDGYEELLNVKRVHNHIIDVRAVRDNPFVLFSPFRFAHRAIGTSLFEKTEDIQTTKTKILRAAVNALALSVLPQTVVNQSAMVNEGVSGYSTLEQLINPEVGGHIFVDGSPRDALMDRQVPPGAAQVGLDFLGHFTGMFEDRTGIQKWTRGGGKMPSEAPTALHTILSKSSQLLSLMANNFQTSICAVAKKSVRLASTELTDMETIKVDRAWRDVDPRQFPNLETKITVNYNYSLMSREERMTAIMVIMQKLETVMTSMGLQNPIAGIEEFRNAFQLLTEGTGFSPDSFVMPRDDEKTMAFMKQQAEQKDPDIEKTEMMLEVKMKESEMKMQMNQMDNHMKELVAKINGMMEIMETRLKIESEEKMHADEIVSNEKISKQNANKQKSGTSIRAGGDAG